ncbi:MAG: glycosyltransferase family 39 protein, partial [FCB group bacterium]|nr:glycosyltransferase family 39 protein [FCB group bacterium]
MIDPRLQKPVNAKLVLILIIVFAAVIRLYGIEDKCFSMDEAFSFEVCHGLRYDDTTPDLFYDICSVFLSLPFSNEVNGRLLSVIAGVLTVFVIYYIVNSLFSKKTALMITVMCSINPILVQISQEMRAYGLIAFFLSVSILSILKLAGDRNDEQTGKWKTDYFWILLFIVSSTV